MTQTELASAADGASLRSVTRLEQGQKIRLRAIASIANTLGLPAGELIKLAYPLATEKEIIDAAGLRTEMRPLDFLTDLHARMTVADVPVLFIAAISSKPVASTDDRVFQKMIELIDAGMTLVLCNPFPTGNCIPWSEAPHLAEFYSTVEGWINELVASVGLRLKNSDAKKRIVPLKRRISEVQLVQPPLRMADQRAVLVQFGEEHPKLEFSVYYKRFEQPQARWVVVNPDIGEEIDRERAKQTVGIWSDFFSEILTNWKPKAANCVLDMQKAKFWDNWTSPDPSTHNKSS